MKRTFQRELTGGGIDNVFNLRSETTVDGERQQREADARRKAEAEARELQAKQQPELLNDWQDASKQYQAV